MGSGASIIPGVSLVGARIETIAILLLGCLTVQAAAQVKEEKPFAGQGGNVAVQRWRIGMEITAEGGAFKRIVGATTVPMDWPEQRVRIVQSDLSRGVSVSYQVVDGAARQMVIQVPLLASGETARAVVTFEIHRLLPVAPQDTGAYQLPNPKRLDRKAAPFLAPSPMIESQHPKMRAAAKEAVAGKERAWERVEAIYDAVRKRIEFRDNRGGTVRSAFETLEEGVGDCDEMTSLFVAMCRSLDVPARMVRVPDHCYPEFYLWDAEGKGHWFACQVSGARAFGGMPDPRPVLQKGDNVLIADPATKKKTRSRFLPETLIGFPAGGGGTLKPKLVCQQVREENEKETADKRR